MRNRLLKISYFTLCLMAFFTVRINAYIDPSVMTYAIQAIAGVAIALGTVFSLYWRKIVKAIRNMLGVRGNKHTNEESDDIKYINANTKQELDYTCISEEEINDSLNNRLFVGEKEVKEEVSNETSFKDILFEVIKDLIPGILVALAITYMLAYYAPLEIYMNNKNEFWFNYAIIAHQCVELCKNFVVVLIPFYIASYFINKKFYQWMVNIGVVILLILYIHGNFYASNMPSMDGTTINWLKYSSSIRGSIIITLVVIIVIGILYRYLKTKKFNFVVDFICVVIVMMLMVSLVSISNKTEGKDLKADDLFITTKNLNNYSNDENFIILVVDSTDASIFTKLINSNNEYHNAFKDFTYYPNTTGAYAYTYMAIPYILTGVWYENQEEYKAFRKRTIHESSLLNTLEEYGYRLDIYEEETFIDSDTSRYSNVAKGYYEVSDENLFKKDILNLALFKYTPFYLKSNFTVDLSSFIKSREGLDGNFAYSYYNKDFDSNIEENSISTTDEKVFKFIHIEGAHVPFDYDEYGNYLEDESGTYTQKEQYTIVLLDKYLNELKESGVYDNSTIIILADHGYADGEGNDTDNQEIINRRSNPILLVKKANESHDLVIDQSAITYEDLQGMYQNLLSGKDTWEGLLDDNDRRRFLCYQIYWESAIYEYYQTGYANDTSTMEKTGAVYYYDWSKYK